MLKFILDTLDGLDAAKAGLYAKGDDGKFHLQVDGVEDVTGLKTALQKERDNVKKYEGLVRTWQNLGKTPDEIAELLRQQDEIQRQKEEQGTQDAIKKGEFQKVLDDQAKKAKAERDQIITRHQAELETATKKNQMLTAALEQHLVDAQATTAIAAAKGDPVVLLPHVKSRVKVVEEDGKFTVKVLDAAGNDLIADSKGTPATIANLIDIMKADPHFGRVFEGTNASGGGTPPGNGKGAKAGDRSGTTQGNPSKSPSERLKDHYAAMETK